MRHVFLALLAAMVCAPASAFEVDGYRMGMPRTEVERRIAATGGSFSEPPEYQPRPTGRALFDRVYMAIDRQVRTAADIEQMQYTLFYFCRDSLVGMGRTLDLRRFPVFARIAEREQAQYGKPEVILRNTESSLNGESYGIRLTWDRGSWRRTVGYTIVPSPPNPGRSREDVFEDWMATQFCREW
jgi:hypothetical protein